MERCGWCLCNEKMIRYHDEEWGIPVYDDRKQFEYLMLEVMQCGLNWNMMIQKREIFRECFDNFDFDKIASYKESDVERIMKTEGMIRSERKIRAVISNAKCFQKVREEFGTFSNYLWNYSKGKTILYAGHQKGKIPATVYQTLYYFNKTSPSQDTIGTALGTTEAGTDGSRIPD